MVTCNWELFAISGKRVISIQKNQGLRKGSHAVFLPQTISNLFLGLVLIHLPNPALIHNSEMALNHLTDRALVHIPESTLIRLPDLALLNMSDSSQMRFPHSGQIICPGAGLLCQFTPVRLHKPLHTESYDTFGPVLVQTHFAIWACMHLT